MNEMMERVARAIYKAIEAECAYVGTDDDISCVTIDGDIDLKAAARAAIEGMRDPTEAEFASANQTALLGANYQGYSLAAGTWRAMIDAALK